jgi:DNA-binding transcriptional ArsR family regulator
VIEIELDVVDATQTRITSNAVWETTAAVQSTLYPRRHLLHQRLASLVPRSPRFDMDLLAEVTAGKHWVPDALGPAPSSTAQDPRSQIAAIADTSLDTASSDLAVFAASHPGSRVAAMSPSEYVERLSLALGGYWEAVLAPMWERVEAVVDADIELRRTVLARDGLAAAIDGMHDWLSVDASRIRVDLRGVQISTRATGSGVWFVPSVFIWPWVSVDCRTSAPVVCYGARGTARVWETGVERTRGALGGLIGRTRASLLHELEIPRTTTSLALQLGLSPGTISSHLAVMTESGLLTSRRKGRTVLYERTPMGSSLAQFGEESALMETDLSS